MKKEPNLATVCYIGHGNIFSIGIARRWKLNNKRKLRSAVDVQRVERKR